MFDSSKLWRIAPVALVLCLAPSALPGSTPSKVYRDPVHKFSLKIFPDWEQVPIDPTEQWEVAKFYDPANKGDYFRPELTVFRIAKNEPVDGGSLTGSGGGKRPEIPPEILERFKPKGAYQLSMARLIVPPGEKLPDEKDFKEFVSSEKVKGKVWTASIAHQKGDKNATVFAQLVTFEKDGVEYGIYCNCTEQRRKGFEPAYRTIAKSFQFFDERAKDVATLDVLDGVNISPGRRSKIERSMIKGWGVSVSPKKNYIVIYNTNRNKNKALARQLAERIELIREQIYEKQFPSAKPIDAVSVMRICANQAEYHAYGGPPGSAGYWNSGSEELVFYDMSRKKDPDEDTLAVLYHEAFHQYIYYSVGNVAPHSWFNEGHGDYYAGARFAGSKVSIKPFNWRIGTVKNAIREGPRASRIEKDPQTGKERKIYDNSKGYTPLADLVNFSQRDYYSYPGVSYAQGWSLIYFLREIVPKNKAMNAKWGKILDVYFDTLKAEVNRETPLDTERKPEPEDPAPDGPGNEPDPAKPEPGEPGAPGAPGEPGEPGAPGDPADPGDGDGDGDGEGGEEEPTDPGFQPIPTGFGSDNALQKAIQAAFKDVDFEEFEAAWREATLKISG